MCFPSRCASYECPSPALCCTTSGFVFLRLRGGIDERSERPPQASDQGQAFAVLLPAAQAPPLFFPPGARPSAPSSDAPSLPAGLRRDRGHVTPPLAAGAPGYGRSYVAVPSVAGPGRAMEVDIPGQGPATVVLPEGAHPGALLEVRGPLRAQSGVRARVAATNRRVEAGRKIEWAACSRARGRIMCSLGLIRIILGNR